MRRPGVHRAGRAVARFSGPARHAGSGRPVDCMARWRQIEPGAKTTMNPVQGWAGLFATGLLCACASAPTDRPSPMATSLPPAWHAVLPVAAAADSPQTGWVAFGDPVLLALIEAARAASPSLAVAQARIERARAALAGAQAAQAPRLDATAQASRARQVPRQAAAASGFVGVQAGWELDLFGAVRAGRVAPGRRPAGWLKPDLRPPARGPSGCEAGAASGGRLLACPDGRSDGPKRACRIHRAGGCPGGQARAGAHRRVQQVAVQVPSRDQEMTAARRQPAPATAAGSAHVPRRRARWSGAPAVLPTQRPISPTPCRPCRPLRLTSIWRYPPTAPGLLTQHGLGSLAQPVPRCRATPGACGPGGELSAV
jgi:hypothetical protein